MAILFTYAQVVHAVENVIFDGELFVQKAASLNTSMRAPCAVSVEVVQVCPMKTMAPSVLHAMSGEGEDIVPLEFAK